ncbi:MAG: SDR family oxidoreductase [Bacilli bacterium]|nr:SDR family oxidoreductase [Bacilli bacterium]
MLALITGASSGLGREMAIYLSELGYDLILVARRKERLQELQKSLPTHITIFDYDLQKAENIYELHKKVQDQDIDLLINNAGFGLFGMFSETSLDRELEMIDLNIKAYHIMTKLFLQDMMKKDRGRILNVASAAGFLAGPGLNTYYATKNYVAKLSIALYEELRRQKSHVHISVLCPGPVATEFNKVAKGTFQIEEENARKIARRAIVKTLKNKLIIVPDEFTKIGLFLTRFLPWKLSARIVYLIQKRK